MALMNCRECAAEISTLAASCPKCGAPNARESSGRGWIKWAAGVPACIFLVFLGIGAVESNTPEGEARAKDRSAIELCWKNQARKSIDERTGQFIADVCERLESEFREKHKREP